MLVQREVFRRLCRARDLLAGECDGAPSVAEVARVVGISQFHLIRQFHAVFGATPHQFRIQRRLELAKDLLARGDRPVTEICMDVGFSSLGSFSDLFTRRVGTSPSRYRRRMRTMVQVPGGLEPVLAPGCLSLMAAAFASFEKRAARAHD